MTEDVVDSRLGHEASDRGVRTSSIVEVDEASEGAQPVARLGGHSLVFQGHFELPVPSAESHAAMAQILAGEGRVEEALAEARTGVALAPQAMDTHLSLAQILVQAKQLPSARTEYLESIRLAETQGEGYWWASIGVARQGLAQLNAPH